MNTNFPRSSRTLDFWRVNSYGYPCFFSDSEKAQDSWNTFLSFFDFTAYDKLKDYWASTSASRKLSAAAIESWKATFEEFGLLYVESKSNAIVITPAGRQLRDAADTNKLDDFAWIGLNLLLRYPLRGPRRAKSEAHKDSDLLLYRFWYAALLDLDGFIWRTEFERILCRVFQTNESIEAVEDIKTLRESPDLIAKVSRPVLEPKGAFYNSLNQVVVHAGMNHLLMVGDEITSPYGSDESKRKDTIREIWRGMIRQALSDPASSSEMCSTNGSVVARLPTAPLFNNEIEYFDYLGSPVITLSQSQQISPMAIIPMQGEHVFFLEESIHFYPNQTHDYISGPIGALCQIALGQRLILSNDEHWTYLVDRKDLLDSDNVKIQIRRARPITNIEVIRTLRDEG